ncbi:MAG: PA0069 family radical SAM protein [Bacteroidota bacterium]
MNSSSHATPRKGRGAQLNPPNQFLSQRFERSEWEAIDLPESEEWPTQVFKERGKTILNKVKSPDIPLPYSMNPYQGCEHGCVYCYARNTHPYYGFSAGLDFESKIMVKENAAELLEEAFDKKSWKPQAVMFSGNTDCYQPLERKLELTRKCLEVFVKYRHPVGMITKNSLILRDIDLLQDLAKDNLVHVTITITTLNEELRRKLEPRTVPGKRRVEVIRKLSEAGIPVGLSLSPVIPGLNQHEIPDIVKAAADAGACSAFYIVLRLNGEIGGIFENWLEHHYPDRKEKVLHQVRELHGGKLEDNRFGKRMRGEGPVAEAIRGLFYLARNKYMPESGFPALNLAAFKRPDKGQLSLF